MTAQFVEAVFFWRFSTTTYKAVYGRLRPPPGAGGSYTKDFFQSPASQWPIIDEVLHRPSNGDVPLQYRWPGGTTDGTWRPSRARDDAPRGQMAWETNQKAPVPWRIGDSQANPAISIEGDPGKQTEADADAVLEQIKARDEGPWFLAIKLQGQSNVLHPRVYFERPPPNLTQRSLAVLPDDVQQAIRQLPAGVGGGAFRFSDIHASDLVRRIWTTLQTDTNVLLVGPPGTGKTVAIEELASIFEGRSTAALFDPDTLDGGWSQLRRPNEDCKSLDLVFHPSFEYEEFVAGLVPVPEGHGFRLEALPGPFLSMAHWTSGNRCGLLLIDEFNRGNAAAIFGDMLPLLDSSKRRTSTRPGKTVLRPYPRHQMNVDQEFAQPSGDTALSPTVSLSDKLWIVAALNSTDRSVAPIDAALRRRFAIIDVEPDYPALALHWGIPTPSFESEFQDKGPALGSWVNDNVLELGVRLLFSLNQRIGFVLGGDFLLGHALLWPVQGGSVSELVGSLSRAIDERISSTLRMTFTDQDESLASVLNAGPAPAPGEQPGAGGTRFAHWKAPPVGMEIVATPKLVLAKLSQLDPAVALRAIVSLL
jgi:5-methylcytosine-specific restriction protein B